MLSPWESTLPASLPDQGLCQSTAVLNTTLSPCAMCSGAILLYGIPEVIIGENQTFQGEEDLLRARGVKLTVLQDQQCIRMMEEFIRTKPELWNEDIGV